MIFGSIEFVVGMGLPAFYSYKSLRSRKAKAVSHWTIYWIVYTTFKGVTQLADIFLKWIPLYSVTKMLFVFWLWAPPTKGALLLYKAFILPYLMQNENKIDAWVDSTSAGAFEISRNALRKFAVLIQQAFLSAISDSSSGYKASESLLRFSRHSSQADAHCTENESECTLDDSTLMMAEISD